MTAAAKLRVEQPDVALPILDLEEDGLYGLQEFLRAHVALCGREYPRGALEESSAMMLSTTSGLSPKHRMTS